MDKEEKLIREYFKFDDINQTETISVLPLTLIDMLLEYKHKIKKLHTYRVQKLEEIIKRFMQATEIAKMQNGDWFKEVYNDAGALNLHNVSNNEALESSSDGVAVCDCYKYKYSESGKRRWCSNCGREDIGF